MTELRSITDLFEYSLVERLEAAYRSIFGERFELEIRAVAENQPWYSETISIAEVFRLWVSGKASTAASGLWLFDPLRMSDRRHFLQEMGISRQSVVTHSPEELADLCLQSLGLPKLQCGGAKHFFRQWENLQELVLGGDDEKASVNARQ